MRDEQRIFDDLVVDLMSGAEYSGGVPKRTINLTEIIDWAGVLDVLSPDDLSGMLQEPLGSHYDRVYKTVQVRVIDFLQQTAIGQDLFAEQLNRAEEFDREAREEMDFRKGART